MARATSLSLSKFTTTVEAAVKAAVQKHPKFKGETPAKLAVSYLVWGIPVSEALADKVTVREAQGFATELASHVGGGLPGAGVKREGVVLSLGDYLIVGIPVDSNILLER